MDSTEIGRFGTLRLVKRLDPQTIVASFPIDDESVTFGRDPNCSVRLYYPTVSAVHAKIFFQERKAFLVVLGTNGLFVDGCQVFPAQTESSPTTIPLPNNSEIEIHKKRFIFTYPPKDLRSPAIDINTPARTTTTNSGNKNTTARKRTLRLSMIQSAEVFSPRPSADPSVNLKVLQSPLKPRPVSPVKPSLLSRLREAKEDEENEEEIVLVDGNHPRVVEEEKDLVILEDVPYAPPSPQVTPPSPQSRSLISSFPTTPNVPPPQTPRRGLSRPSLHKAVLIRSAQRAIMQAELRTGNNTIMAADDGDTTEEEEEVKEAAMNVSSTSGEDSESGEEYDSSDEEEESEQNQKPVSRWRKSLEMIGGLFRSSATPEQEDTEGQDREEKENEDAPEAIYSSDEDEDTILNDNRQGAEDEDENDNDDMEIADAEVTVYKYTEPAPSTPRQATAGPYRTLGKFMTPQAAPSGLGRGRGAGGRFSIGTALAASAGMHERDEGAWGGARRVRRESAWKVRDIVVPVNEQNEEEQEEEQDEGEEEGEVANELILQPEERDVATEISSPTKAARAKLSEEERKAIQDRRRSALTTPDAFFGGQAPGIGGPRKTSLAYAYAVATPARAAPAIASPVKKVDSVAPAEDEDTKALLDRMKETVEGMKRRRSGVPPTPNGKMSLTFAKAQADVESTQRMEDGNEEFEEDEEGSDKENHSDAIDSPTEDVSSDQDELVLGNPTKTPVRPTNTTTTNTPHIDLKHIVNASSAPPKTPSFKGVREMFQDHQQAEPQTPKMDGMKTMFRQPKVPETPAFEGVGEMMRTPAAYRMSILEEEGEEEEIVEAVKPKRGRSASATPASSSKPPSSSKTTTRGKASRSTASKALKTPVTEGKSNFADDEATPCDALGRVEEEEESAKKPVARRGRSKVADSSDVEDSDNKPQRKARLIRSSKRAIEDIPEEQTEQTEAQSGRSRKASALDTEEADEKAPARKTKAATRTKMAVSTDDEGTSSRPARRIAKPASTAEETDTKPTRKVASRKPKTLEISETEPEPTKTTTRKPRAGSRTTDDESAVPVKKASRTKANAVEEVESADDPAPTAKSRKSRDESTTDATEETTKAGTGKRVPAKRTTKAPTKRIASGENDDGVDKENAPSMEDEEPTKAKRVTRAKTTRSSAKEETEIEDAPVTKPKATRTTRARK